MGVKFPRRITVEDQGLAQFDDFREVAAAPEGVEPRAADEPIRVALEVAPFVVIGEARGRDSRPRRQYPQRLHVRLAKRAVYRRPCVDHGGLRNPVDLWLAGGGKFHRKARRKISAPAEVLPCWQKGIEAEVNNQAIRDALWFGLYTGMRRDEVLTLRWERVDMEALTFRVEETKTRVPLELPITRQLAAILQRRQTAVADLPAGIRDWVFPSRTSATGHVEDPHHHYASISKAGGAKFWFHGLRNCFITVAERELMLHPSLTKRLVNHARPNDVTEGYAADWTVAQLREPAQKIADRIQALAVGSEPDTAAA